MRKKAPLILLVFNLILLFMAWLMAFYAYPRLPKLIPLWLNCCGQPLFLIQKSWLFYLYPISQTLFFLLFLILSGIFPKNRRKDEPELLYKEYVFLALIFFNLIFIHTSRSLIFLAHNITYGMNKLYFLALFVFLLGLIPYFRMRKKHQV